MTAELYVYCPVCGLDRPAEQPLSGLCEDAHEDEALCAECGAAVFVDPPVLCSAGPAAVA
jgi:hypothetical protein